MLKKISLYGLLIILLSTVTACDSSVNSNSVKKNNHSTLKGQNSQVLYLQKIKLPDGARLEVRLEDATSSTLISQKTVSLHGRPPYMLELDYSGSSIKSKRMYRLSSEIKLDGKLLLMSRQSINSFVLQLKEPLEIKMDPVIRTAQF